MLPFFAGKIFSISFFISLDFYLQVLLFIYLTTVSITAPPRHLLLPGISLSVYKTAY